MQPPPPGFDTWEAWAGEHNIPAEERTKYSAVIDPDGVGPRILFQRVPEGKTAKNRVHLDVNVGAGAATPEERQNAVKAASTRLVTAGASIVDNFDEHGNSWIVMRDPEGNEFCLQ